jgi:hypothetical protein
MKDGAVMPCDFNVLERDRAQNRSPLLLIALRTKLCYKNGLQQKWIPVLRENAPPAKSARFRHASPSASV